jgi:hypothetical protein
VWLDKKRVSVREGEQAKQRALPRHVFDHSNILSRLTFEWMRPMIDIGIQRRLEVEDIPELPHVDTTAFAAERFQKAFDLEKQKLNPSFLILLVRLYGKEVAIFALWSTLNKCIGLGSPLLIKVSSISSCYIFVV